MGGCRPEDFLLTWGELQHGEEGGLSLHRPIRVLVACAGAAARIRHDLPITPWDCVGGLLHAQRLTKLEACVQGAQVFCWKTANVTDLQAPLRMLDDQWRLQLLHQCRYILSLIFRNFPTPPTPTKFSPLKKKNTLNRQPCRCELSVLRNIAACGLGQPDRPIP